MRRKKYMLGRYKTAKAKKIMAQEKIKWLVSELQQGWNPFVKAVNTKQMTKWEHVISLYKNYLKTGAKKGLFKEKTAYDYQSRVKNFEQFILDSQSKLDYIYEFDKNLCVEFLDYLYIDKDVSAVTRNGYRTWLSAFSSWLIDKGYIGKDENPVKDIKPMREEEKKRDPISKEALSKMKEYLSSHNPHFLLACYIVYYVNIRPEEMRHLKLSYIDIKNCTVSLPGKYAKNRKRQEVAVPKKVLRLMIDLNVFDSPSQYYLFGRDMKPSASQIAINRFRYEWSKMRKVLGWPDTYQFYSLKDTGISENIAKHGLLAARDQARHSDATTTNRYAKAKRTAHEELKEWDGDL